jgi:hypothetical protein
MSYQTAPNRQKAVVGRPSANMRPESNGLSTGFLSRELAIGLLLVVALLSFEIFNFDTTRFALADLLGDISFLGLRWATILAIAFCAIDFAGLAHLLSPQGAQSQQKEVWYLMGAWLLGATMNALMTWWAVSLTLLSHEFGNEVLSRGQLLQIVPVFVAVLVWLTRILFIGAFSVAGNQLFGWSARRTVTVIPKSRQAQKEVQKSTLSPYAGQNVPLTTDDVPAFLRVDAGTDEPESPAEVESTSSGSIGRHSLHGVPMAAKAARRGHR